MDSDHKFTDMVKELRTKLHHARLVLRWVTIHGCAVLVCNQPLRPSQPPTFSGMASEYWPWNSGRARQLGAGG